MKQITVVVSRQYQQLGYRRAAARARAFGFEVLACASTGNLANSVAANAAALGMESYVFIPADLEEQKILATGVYGRDLPNQNGAPIRLHVPWKYGFKSIKSIVHIRLVDKQPRNSWQLSSPNEYGFYSNVNPEVDHPRWSQASERRIGEFARRKTLMFNGYADQVASMYSGMDLRKNY